jgi:hypothetical protein
MLQLTIENDGVAKETEAMIDRVVTANFIRRQYCLENQLLMQRKTQPIIELIDGSHKKSEPNPHENHLRIQAANYTVKNIFEVTTLGGSPIILGLSGCKKPSY